MNHLFMAGLPPKHSTSRLGSLYKSHRIRVRAIAQIGWTGTNIEDVAEMCVALAARNRSPIYAQPRVTYFDDVLLAIGHQKAGQPVQDSNLVSEQKTASSG